MQWSHHFKFDFVWFDQMIIWFELAEIQSQSLNRIWVLKAFQRSLEKSNENSMCGLDYKVCAVRWFCRTRSCSSDFKATQSCDLTDFVCKIRFSKSDFFSVAQAVLAATSVKSFEIYQDRLELIERRKINHTRLTPLSAL